MDSASQRTPDTTIPMYASGNSGSSLDLDLSEVAAKQHAGGGMLDSIANMANSILGAGKLHPVHIDIYTHKHNRHHWYVHSQTNQTFHSSRTKVYHMP